MLRNTLRRALWLISLVYFGSILLQGSGSKLHRDALPAPAIYFSQVACLFPRAALMTIEYRAQGQRCDDGTWEEIDTRPHFPIRANDKENRFHRALFFHRRRANVVGELDDYLWNRIREGEVEYGRLRFLSLRIPFPETRHDVVRFERKPLEEYPEEQRKTWWNTPRKIARDRCAGGAQ